MQIYGLDFTSAPGRTKPITCTACAFDGTILRVCDLERFDTFAAFETFLKRDGAWIAGIDFPFGQPRKLIVNIGWPQTWAGYVGHMAPHPMDWFVGELAVYRAARPRGDKQHLRIVDERANARSPMMLYGVPVGRMFFQGAPRLLRSSLSILPCRPTGDGRIVVEAYPRLVANTWIGLRQSYKHDDRSKQTREQERARKALVIGMQTSLRQRYGFDIALSREHIDALIADPSGDTLDSVLCAIQAAWAYTQREQRYGLPADCDPLEGWIADPQLQ